LGHQIGENEIGGTCSTYGGEKRRIHGFGGNLKEGDHLENPGVDGSIIIIIIIIIIIWIFRKWDAGRGLD
jgi:hypothetical protein